MPKWAQLRAVVPVRAGILAIDDTGQFQQRPEFFDDALTIETPPLSHDHVRWQRHANRRVHQ